MSAIDWGGTVPPRGWGLKVSIRLLNAGWSDAVARIGARLPRIADEAAWRAKAGLASVVDACGRLLPGHAASPTSARGGAPGAVAAARAMTDAAGVRAADPAPTESTATGDHPALGPDSLTSLWTHAAIESAALATAVTRAGFAASVAMMTPSLASWASAFDQALDRVNDTA